MRVRVIKDKRIPIDTSSSNKKNEIFDSTKFDNIPSKVIFNIFEKKYQIHKEKLLELVLSRIALSTAISNVEDAIKNTMNNNIIINTDRTVDALDNGFTIATVAYAYNDAFSFIEDEDVRNDIITTMIVGIKGIKARQSVGTTSSRPDVGIHPNMNKISSELDTLNELMEKTKEKNKSVYGNPTDVGTLGRRNAPR